MVEGVEYEKVVLRVVLPEGAANVKYETTVPVMSAETELHRTFMDTLGRTTLKLTALNVVDDIRERELVVSKTTLIYAATTLMTVADHVRLLMDGRLQEAYDSLRLPFGGLWRCVPTQQA